VPEGDDATRRTPERSRIGNLPILLIGFKTHCLGEQTQSSHLAEALSVDVGLESNEQIALDVQHGTLD